MLSVLSPFQPKSVTLLATLLLAGSAYGQNAMLVVLKNQPAREIVKSLQSEADLRQAAEQATDRIRAATGTEQGVLESRLIGLGARGIRRYTAINMLET